jgi:hypothetical protein
MYEDFHHIQLSDDTINSTTTTTLTTDENKEENDEDQKTVVVGTLHDIRLQRCDRRYVLNVLLTKRKSNPNFKVIDVGGSMTGWSGPVVDAIVDLNPPPTTTGTKSNIKFFKCNINIDKDWKAIENYVAKNGKFDFSLCCHTLEDIANPQLVCQKLSLISKEGYVAFPSKYTEMCKTVECPHGSYRGYIHHRYIFTIIQGKLWGFPKLNFLENNPVFDRVGKLYTPDRYELCMWWKDSLDLHIVNQDFMGPSKRDVETYYLQLLHDDLDIALNSVTTGTAAA